MCTYSVVDKLQVACYLGFLYWASLLQMGLHVCQDWYTVSVKSYDQLMLDSIRLDFCWKYPNRTWWTQEQKRQTNLYYILYMYSQLQNVFFHRLYQAWFTIILHIRNNRKVLVKHPTNINLASLKTKTWRWSYNFL